MTDAPRSRARSAAAHSDAVSMRRIGDALLLAQNRARVSTERANRSERILRTVLSQINLQSGVLLHELEDYPRSMSFDSLADWDLLRTLVENPALDDTAAALAPLRYAPSPQPPSSPSPTPLEQTTFALSMAHARATPHTLSSPPQDDATEDIRAVARDVVLNLHVAARTADGRIQKLARLQGPSVPSRFSFQGWLARVLGVEAYYYARPWQFMAGVMLGFALGIVTTRRLFLVERTLRPVATLSHTKHPSALLMDQPSLAASGTTPSSVSGVSCRSSALTKRQMNKLHLAASRLPVTFAMEDMSYLLHPPTEVS